jgi:hypothetical protein
VNLCGDTAIVNEFDVRNHPISVVEVQPRTTDALALSIVGEQFLVVGAGQWGRWELGYTDEDVTRARQIIEAVGGSPAPFHAAVTEVVRRRCSRTARKAEMQEQSGWFQHAEVLARAFPALLPAFSTSSLMGSVCGAARYPGSAHGPSA